MVVTYDINVVTTTADGSETTLEYEALKNPDSR